MPVRKYFPLPLEWEKKIFKDMTEEEKEGFLDSVFENKQEYCSRAGKGRGLCLNIRIGRKKRKCLRKTKEIYWDMRDCQAAPEICGAEHYRHACKFAL